MPSKRITPGLRVNDLEDSRCYQRLFESFQPVNVQQEADLCTLAQLRWSHDRYTSLIETNLNRHIRASVVNQIPSPGDRLLAANRRAMGDPDHLQMLRQREISIRCTIPLANRVDKWRSTK